jgi:hypothetical protein
MQQVAALGGLSNRRKVSFVAALVVLAFLVLIGPLAVVYAVDSRRLDDRGWFGARRN